MAGKALTWIKATTSRCRRPVDRGEKSAGVTGLPCAPANKEVDVAKGACGLAGLI